MQGLAALRGKVQTRREGGGQDWPPGGRLAGQTQPGGASTAGQPREGPANLPDLQGHPWPAPGGASGTPVGLQTGASTALDPVLGPRLILPPIAGP